MMHPADHLFQRFCRTGDPAALAGVFDHCAAELLRVAMHVVGDSATAEDLVQETFVLAIEKRARFDGRRLVLPWLLSILANLVRRQRRARREFETERLSLSEVEDPALAAERGEFLAAFAKALDSWPETYRPVLALHLENGLTAKEIGAALLTPVRGLAAMRRAVLDAVSLVDPNTKPIVLPVVDEAEQRQELPQPELQLRVHVIYGRDHSSAAGIAVFSVDSVSNRILEEAVTGEAGGYAIRDLASHQGLRIWAVKEGWRRTRYEESSLMPGATHEKIWVLQRSGQTLTGEVIGLKGMPAPGVDIELVLHGLDGPPLQNLLLRSDEAGRFVVEGLPSGVVEAYSALPRCHCQEREDWPRQIQIRDAAGRSVPSGSDLGSRSHGPWQDCGSGRHAYAWRTGARSPG